MEKFKPKQCPPPSPELLSYFMGGSTGRIAEHCVTLLQDVGPESIIHDNGCGTGEVSQAIISKLKATSSDSEHGITVHATDFIRPMIDLVASRAKAEAWTDVVDFRTSIADTQNMPSIPSNTFTHSITGFVLQSLPQPTLAAAEIYRTLKPGGVAIVTGWTDDMPVITTIVNAGKVMRGPDSKLHVHPPSENFTAAFFEEQLRKGGFKEVTISQRETTSEPPNVKKWCETAWGLTGMPVTGWTVSDEERWDEAVDIVEKCLRANDMVSVEQDGSVKMRALAWIAVARKS